MKRAEDDTTRSADLTTEAEAEIARFEEWFSSRGEHPLIRCERAILLTYLLRAAEGSFGSTFVKAP